MRCIRRRRRSGTSEARAWKQRSRASPPAAAPWRPPAAGEPMRLLFVGTVDYWPYELGIAWFLREAMPLLRAQGAVAFDVVGAPPPDPVRAPDVVYHGRVADVHRFY